MLTLVIITIFIILIVKSQFHNPWVFLDFVLCYAKVLIAEEPFISKKLKLWQCIIYLFIDQYIYKERNYYSLVSQTLKYFSTANNLKNRKILSNLVDRKIIVIIIFKHINILEVVPTSACLWFTSWLRRGTEVAEQMTVWDHSCLHIQICLFYLD